MNGQQLQDKAVDAILRRVEGGSPKEPIVLQEYAEADFSEETFRNVSVHQLHVLERAGDLIVFFDEAGQITGWRDDGRKGTPQPAWVDRDGFLSVVVGELGLPKQTRLGKLEPAVLPPVGWTHEAVLFTDPLPREDQVLRVWASPENLRVIQCLYGPPPERP